MKKIDRLEFWEEDVYTISKEEALKKLAEANITTSEQIFLRWCREEKIDAVRITGAAVDKRGVLVNPLSLRAFISARMGAESVEKLYVRIYRLEEEKREYEARVAFLEEKLNAKKKK